ncbi:DUF2125 domain-containing protein [Mycoplana dimorpha]|uniref:DUF2125 domain-containing protein n=1 Tax=Mycoplana dimorpha TaxID=28320 RepID=A0A2T5BC35_MYCDI|nr:DUF2125 domain-containing protein [Mycoplana dimorpha]PTM96548.1 hypothetical protein C7449_103568 [Mycoplana dimorpha]
MTPMNGATGGTSARKVWILALAIAAFLALYTVAWFFGADRLKGYVRHRLSDASVAVACTGLEVRGFPFRIGVFCDAVGIDDKRTGTSASFGALRSAAQVYRPGHAVMELDGPALVRVSPDIALTADWNLMQASAVAGTVGLERASIASNGLKGTFTADMGETKLAFLARHGETHLRANGEALDAALSLDGLELTAADTVVPKADVIVDMTIADAAGWLQDGPPINAPRRTKGDIRNLRVDFGNGNSAAVSGNFAIDDEGLLSGKFQLEISGIDALRDAVAQAFPEIADTASSIADTIRGLSGGKNARVKLRANDGVLYLGLIPIATIAAL